MNEGVYMYNVGCYQIKDATLKGSEVSRADLCLCYVVYRFTIVWIYDLHYMGWLCLLFFNVETEDRTLV